MKIYDPKNTKKESLTSLARKQRINKLKDEEENKEYYEILQQKENLRDKFVNNYIKENKLTYNEKNVDVADAAFEQEYKVNYNNLYNELNKYQQEYSARQPQYSLVDTILNLGINAGEGFLNTVEGVVDTGRMLGADVTNFFVGENDLSKWLKERAEQDSTGALFGKNDDLAIQGWTKGIEQRSLSNDLIDSIAQGIGNIGAFVGFGGLGAAAGATSKTAQVLTTAGTSFSSSYGNTYTELKRQGVDDSTARKNALVSALAETASEQFFDKIPGLTSAGWGDKLTGRLNDAATKFFGSKSGKIVSTILDGMEEGSEEIISNMLQQFGNDVMYMIDDKYTYNKENSLLANGYQFGDITRDVLGQITTEESLQAFLSASISSFLVSSGKVALTTKQRNQIINAYAKDNNMSFNDAKYILTGEETLNQVKQEIKQDKTEYNSNLELEEMAKDRMMNYAQQTNTDYINQRINEMEEDRGEKFTKEEREGLFNVFKNRTETEINSPQRYESFKLEKEPTNEQEKVLYDSFVKNSNNTQQAHDLYDFYSKLRKDNPNANYQLTSNDELVEMGLLEKQGDKYGRTINGKFVEETPNGINVDGKILINRDGLNAFEATTWHEIAHSIKDTSPEGYTQLKNIVKQVYGENDFDNFKQKYENLYGDNQENLEDEYVNDKLGELLNNERFYNRVTENRNLLQRIIDKLKEMVKYISSNTEQRNLMKIQKKLEDTYMELYKGTKFEGAQDAQYSITQGKEETSLSYAKQRFNRNIGKYTFGDNLEDAYLEHQLRKDELDNLYEYAKKKTYNESQLKELERRYNELLERDNPNQANEIRYSLSQDSQGKELTKEQQEYFKDSKATDENGNLIKVYHTTTDEIPQFNEFNPVGTPYYRFGDQVVNYYTDDKDMSGSYANQDYQMADTKKLNSVNETREYLDKLSEETGNKFTLYQREDGKWLLSQDKQISKEARDFLNSLTDEEKQQMKDNIFVDTEEIGSNYDRSFMWDKFDKELQRKFNAALDKYMGTADLVAIQQEMMKYLDIPDSLRFETEEYGTGIGFYETEDELFRNIKHDIQDNNWSKNSKLQYQGYVNITNPYIVDAEQRNWNQVVTQSNDFIDELDERVDQETKDKLTRLYNESANKSAELREKQAVYSDALYDVGAASSLNVDDDIRKMSRVLNRVDNAELKAYLETGEPGHKTSFYSSLANALVNEEIIDYDMEDSIRENWALPDDVRQWLVENYNKQFKTSDINANNVTQMISVIGRTTSLKDLADNRDEAYREYDKYRYPQSYFIEQLQEGNEDIGYELDDMLETRAEIMGADAVAEEIAQAASVGFSKPELIKLWGTSKTTNDVVKEIIESNREGTTDYDGVIIKNVVDYGGKAGVGGTSPHDLYVTFNSNQFKASDNLNPTEDTDIRYQLQQEAQQRGYGTYTEDISSNRPERNLPIAEDTELPFYESEQTTEERMEDRRRRFADERFKKMIEKQTYKSINTATKMAKSYLDFNQKETTDFKNKISKLSKLAKDNLIKAKNYNQLKDIIKQYATKEQTFVNEEIKEAQKDIRKTQLIVSDDLKAQITDWSDFRRTSGLNIRKGEKSNVDTIYEELVNSYPGMLDASITNYADQLQELSDFLKRDNKYIEHFELSDDSINNITNKVWEKLSNNALTQQEINDLQQDIMSKAERRTREVVQQDLLETMGLSEQDLQVGKDVTSLTYQRTDPRRLNEKVFGYDVGQKINKATNGFVQHQEANKIRWQNKERADIENLGIKARSKMSAAVQKYGEKQYVNDKGEVVEYNDQSLMSEFPNVQDQEKIKQAAEVLRQKYDDYIDRMNESLMDMGYDPVPKRKDYFRHFMELDDKLSQFGFTFSKENIMKEELPTDINGLTDGFKPGKNFFASAMARKGLKTTYDAITGIDQYLEGVGNVIYHTESIQRYRALSKLIRETYGQTHGTDNIEMMTPEEAQQRIQDVYDNKLSRYAAWLDEQANALAGKKAAIDRSVERIVGRKGYTLLNGLKKQVGSNMTGYNVRSAMTNFASAIQGASKTEKLSALKGFAFALRNYRNLDPLIQKSDMLATRFGTDALSKKTWQKMSEAGQVFMNATDRFTTLQIWGGKYYEGLHNGLSEQEAINQADDFTSRVMGDRSKGQTAEIFNSKTLGLFTQFQLEVNNQWSSMIHDNKMAMKQNPGLKSGLHIANQLGQLYAASWFFNNFMKAVTGSDVMFDPIDMLMEIFNPDDDKDLEEKATTTLGKLINNLPMASIFTGGRIPLSEAFKGVDTGFKYLTGQKDIYGNNYSLEDVGNDFLGSLAYYVMPTGYGQLRKTTQGLGMYTNELPGSYTNSGRLRFEADTSPLGVAQAALFGQYASGEAREYFDKGYAPLTEKQIQEVKDVNLPVSEYREIDTGIKKAKQEAKENDESQTEAQVDYIYNLPLSDDQKNTLVNSRLNRDVEIDISDYGKYGSLEEFDYANKNPEKYKTITQIANYNDYQIYKQKISDIKDTYESTDERKNAVFDYINGLPMNQYQKIMLYKMAGGYSIKGYKNQMFDYINSLDLSKKTKENIYDELFDANLSPTKAENPEDLTEYIYVYNDEKRGQKYFVNETTGKVYDNNYELVTNKGVKNRIAKTKYNGKKSNLREYTDKYGKTYWVDPSIDEVYDENYNLILDNNLDIWRK